MSRKPVDKQQPCECRQAMWAWIRKNETDHGPNAYFTLNDIALHINLDISSIREYLTGLSNAEHLIAAKGSTRMSPTLYTLVNDTGIDAPSVRRDGTPVTMGQGRQQMWNAMQVLREFSPRDLAFNAGTEAHPVAESDAKTYCGARHAAGYLVLVQKSTPGTQARYSMITAKWSGPHPPQIQRTKQIYDPNLKKVVWSRVERGAE